MASSDGSPYPRLVPYLALISAVGVGTPLPAWARAAFALPLVLYLPGIALVAAALPGARRTAELQVLAVAMSLTATVLLGVALEFFVGTLTPLGWELGLCSITVCGCVASMRKVRRPKARFPWLRVSERRLEPPPVGSTPGPGRAGYASAALIVVAVGVGAGAYLLARQGAVAQREFRYTDFWMVPEDADRPTMATVGIRNEEAVAASYDVDILVRGHLADQWPTIKLGPGEAFSSRLAFPSVDRPRSRVPASTSDDQAVASRPARPAGPEADRVEARLYKDGDHNVIYRKTWIALPPSEPLAPKATKAQE